MKRRMGAMVKKEFIQLSRDRRTLAMMILLPVIWLVAFGYAVSFDIDQVNVVAVDQAENEASRNLLKELAARDEFVLEKMEDEQQAEKRLSEGEADVVILFPAAYRTFPQQKEEQLEVRVDGSRLFTAQSALRKVNDFLLDLQQEQIETVQEEVQKLLEAADEPLIDLSSSEELAVLSQVLPAEQMEKLQGALGKVMAEAAEERAEAVKGQMEELFPDADQIGPTVEVLYNPDLKSVHYMIPGLVGLVLIFITTLMTALGIVREKERGTLEQLIVSPLRPFELILGKLLPYMFIALIDFLLVLGVGVTLFDVPFTGEVGSFFLVALLFLIGSLGIGLLISMVSQNQQQAMQLAVLTLVPQFILSGFVFPLEAMPWGIRWVAYLMPLTYFLPISRGVFLKEASAFDFPFEFGILTVYAVLFITVAAIRFRRSLA